MTRITRVEIIDGEGRSYVNWNEDNDIVTSIQDDGKTLKVFVNKVKPKTLFDVIRNLGYSVDAVYEIVDAIEEFEKSKEFQPTSQTNEEVEQGLKDAMRTAKEEGVFDTTKESWMNNPVEELVEMLEKNPPECLKFSLGKNLEQLIERWWCDVFSGPHENWSMEECISDLCDRIFLWLPKEQNSDGTQRIETIVAVDTHNELLRKIKSKIHNKKDT
jgi:hypothetical protein